MKCSDVWVVWAPVLLDNCHCHTDTIVKIISCPELFISASLSTPDIWLLRLDGDSIHGTECGVTASKPILVWNFSKEESPIVRIDSQSLVVLPRMALSISPGGGGGGKDEGWARLAVTVKGGVPRRLTGPTTATSGCSVVEPGRHIVSSLSLSLLSLSSLS